MEMEKQEESQQNRWRRKKRVSDRKTADLNLGREQLMTVVAS